MSDTLEQIKEKIDIASFIRKYVNLLPAGRNLKGVCPFHKEKTPSFIVSPDKQIWHCFGCSRGGDVIGFLMQYENISFFEALKMLAEDAGVELRHVGSQDHKALDVLYDIVHNAKDFFISSLRPEIIGYLLNDRGLKKETIEEFGIGFSPNNEDALFRFLLKKGFAVGDIEKAGLVIKGKYKGSYFDRFRNRIMFPLYNTFGKAVGFTGRIMPGAEDGMGKYVNTPETPIFSKSKVLFGFHKAKEYIRESGSAVVMEGQMDFLMAWQAGVKNSVATSGTALTQDHLRMLKRMADQLIFAFDQDDAGQQAIDRAASLALPFYFDVRILKIRHSELKDPADVVRHDPKLLHYYIEKSCHLMDHYFDFFLGGNMSDPLRRKKSVREVLARMRPLSPIDRQYWLKQLSVRSEIGEHVLLEELEHLPYTRTETHDDLDQSEEEVQFSRKDLIAQQVLGCALNYKTAKDLLRQHIHFLPENYQAIAHHIISESELPKESEGLYNFILLRSGLSGASANPDRELADLVRQMKLEYLKDAREALRQKILDLERANADNELREVLKEFDKVSKEMQNL